MALLHFAPNGFLGHDNLKPCRPPSFSVGERGEIQRVKPSLTFLEWPWGREREVVRVCVRTVCVYVCINGCFAPLIMPRYQLRPEGMRGRGSCDWLMRYAILSDSESPFTAVAYWCCPGGVLGARTPACKQGMCLKVQCMHESRQYIVVKGALHNTLKRP